MSNCTHCDQPNGSAAHGKIIDVTRRRVCPKCSKASKDSLYCEVDGHLIITCDCGSRNVWLTDIARSLLENAMSVVVNDAINEGKVRGSLASLHSGLRLNFSPTATELRHALESVCSASKVRIVFEEGDNYSGLR